MTLLFHSAEGVDSRGVVQAHGQLTAPRLSSGLRVYSWGSGQGEPFHQDGRYTQ